MVVNAIDAKIVRTLGFAFRAMSIHDISQATGISWITVRSHVTQLMKREQLFNKNKGGRYIID